jgi:hypothetical protein
MRPGRRAIFANAASWKKWNWGMIWKSGYRFSEKIMRKKKDGAGWRLKEKPSRYIGPKQLAGSAARCTDQVGKSVSPIEGTRG